MDWKPIETAPKDRRILLFRPRPGQPGMFVMGRWNDDQHATKPRPYWSHDCERWTSVADARKSPPSHWCDVIEPTF